MLYNTLDYRVFGLCPSSVILKNIKENNVSELDFFPSSGKDVVFFIIPADG
jgi:hypothetical protein